MGQVGRGNGGDAPRSKDHSPQEISAENDRDLKPAGGSVHQKRPDPRRRALIAGLATAPVLLSLTNRSALGLDINCSAFGSLMLGGSVAGLPPGFENIPQDTRESQYRTQCLAEGQGTGNATGNSGQTGNATSTPTGISD